MKRRTMVKVCPEDGCNEPCYVRPSGKSCPRCLKHMRPIWAKEAAINRARKARGDKKPAKPKREKKVKVAAPAPPAKADYKVCVINHTEHLMSLVEVRVVRLHNIADLPDIPEVWQAIKDYHSGQGYRIVERGA